MKKITAILFLVLFASFFSKPVLAGNDISITCSSGGCQKLSNLPFFYENNISPGFTQIQNLSVDNNRNSPCHLKFKADSATQIPNILPEKILFNILGTNNNYTLLNYPLSDLMDPNISPISLGHINKGVKNKYSWLATFSPEAGNEYQETSIVFNLNFNFECDEEDGDDPSDTSDNPPSNQGTEECTSSTPDAPTHLVAYRNQNGSVRLVWDHSTSEHDGYLIAFGNESGSYKYGAPNVGNVTTYTIDGLTYGAQYCFYVRTLNGCMPGGRSPEYCVNPGSTITPTDTIPEPFREGVLGVDTEETEGEVLGTDEEDSTSRWIPLLFIFAFLFNLLIIKKISKRYVIITLLISILAYIIDRQFLKSNYCLGPIWWCKYFWIGNFLSWILPLLIKRLKLTK